MGASVRVSVSVVSLIWLMLVVGCKNEPPDATITQVSGTATMRKHGEGTPLEALVNSGLYATDVVATGSDGRLTLTFTGGNTLTLQPDTTVVIRPGGATGAELGAVLISGSARAASPGSTTHLIIGSPFGMTELGGSELVVDVDLTRGLSVLIGEVSVIRDGATTVLEAGSAMSIDGLVVPVGTTPAPNVNVDDAVMTRKPENATLISNSRLVQVKRVGTNDWAPVQARDTLTPGDIVRTQKSRGTQVRFEDGTGVTLGSNAELRFDEAKGNDKEHNAKYAITSGDVDLHLTRSPGIDATHEVSVAGMGIAVKPGDREADVDIRQSANGNTELAVRFGRVHLSDGTDVDAGNAITVRDGKVVSELRPVVPTNVELRAGMTSIVYYQSNVPPVAFDWKTNDANKALASYQIEVSSDKEHKDNVFTETVRKVGFVYDRFKPGRYYWRVKSGEAIREGLLLIQRGRENDCANCKRTNIINDNGEKTVVYFQQALPSLTFQWKEVAGAQQYRLKIFADGAFEKPLIEATSDTTKLAFQAGALEDGKYFWLVNAVDSNGKTLSTGRTNGLELAYDNVVTDLVIRAPKNGQRINGERVTTVGELALGARLYINGKPTDLDEKGRFRATVSLNGERTIVYRTQASDGVQRFYVRELRR